MEATGDSGERALSLHDELKAIAEIDEVLGELDSASAFRVLQYLADRHCSASITQPPPTGVGEVLAGLLEDHGGDILTVLGHQAERKEPPKK